MEQYPVNENTWLFWTVLALIAFLAAVIVYCVYKSCKVVTPMAEFENPIKYKIDGMNMTYKGAMRYYYKELDRDRIKSTIHLTIYDSENDIYMFDDCAYLLFDNVKPISDAR